MSRARPVACPIPVRPGALILWPPGWHLVRAHLDMAPTNKRPKIGIEWSRAWRLIRMQAGQLPHKRMVVSIMVSRGGRRRFTSMMQDVSTWLSNTEHCSRFVLLLSDPSTCTMGSEVVVALAS